MNEDLLEELKIELQSKDESVRQTALTCLLRLGSESKFMSSYEKSVKKMILQNYDI